MALYVTRPRRDEERIGRGLPSVRICGVYNTFKKVWNASFVNMES